MRLGALAAGSSATLRAPCASPNTYSIRGDKRLAFLSFSFFCILYFFARIVAPPAFCFSFVTLLPSKCLSTRTRSPTRSSYVRVRAVAIAAVHCLFEPSHNARRPRSAPAVAHGGVRCRRADDTVRARASVARDSRVQMLTLPLLSRMTRTFLALRSTGYLHLHLRHPDVRRQEQQHQVRLRPRTRDIRLWPWEERPQPGRHGAGIPHRR